MRRYCLTLDLKDDPKLIQEYEDHHQAVWPEIVQSIKSAGIEVLEIHRYETRLFMIMDVNDQFSFEQKTEADENDPKVQAWETLMWKYQQPLSGAKPGEKWMMMSKIFELK